MSLLLSPWVLQAEIEIRIDYTYDTNNFFDTDEKRAAIEAVADFYGSMMNDTLLRIDPADFSQASWTPRITHPTTGVSPFSVSGLSVVPENVIIVYVGARELGGTTAGRAGPGGWSGSGFDSWFERIRGRGGADADSGTASENTDFALWGGSISFDTPRSWNFSLDSNAPGTEFLKIALHEMGHVLGIGTADSYDNLLNAGTFPGGNAVRSNGSAPSADSSHILGGISSSLFGSFGVSHGSSGPVLMLPSSTDTGSNFDVITDLDLAVLVDIGWELTPETAFGASTLSPTGVSLNWNSVSFKEYAVERTDDLSVSPSTVRSAAAGNADTQSWSDPAPPSDAAFYQLVVADIATVGGRSVPMEPLEKGAKTSLGTYRTETVDPRFVDCSE